MGLSGSGKLLTQGKFITASSAFVSIVDIKNHDNGIEIYELITALHNIIREGIANGYSSVRVLSALIGAIIIIPDDLNINTLDLLKDISSKSCAAGIPIRIGVSHGELQELEDVDGEINYIGVPLNIAARLSTSYENRGLLVHESFISIVEGLLPRSHWLSKQKRVPIAIKGKREEQFTSFSAFEEDWSSCSTINYHFEQNIIPKSKISSVIAYDLPNFSDGNTRQLSQRFRAVADAFQEVLANGRLSLDGFYFSPGGDGGIFILSGIGKEQAFDIGEKFATKLKAESSNRNSSINVECRIGVHYGTTLLYDNAENYLRPTGIDLFIADELTTDKLGNFVFTEAFKDIVSSGDPNIFNENFEEIAPLTKFSNQIKRYKRRP